MLSGTCVGQVLHQLVAIRCSNRCLAVLQLGIDDGANHRRSVLSRVQTCWRQAAAHLADMAGLCDAAATCMDFWALIVPKHVGIRVQGYRIQLRAAMLAAVSKSSIAGWPLHKPTE